MGFADMKCYLLLPWLPRGSEIIICEPVSSCAQERLSNFLLQLVKAAELLGDLHVKWIFKGASSAGTRSSPDLPELNESNSCCDDVVAKWPGHGS